MCCIEFEVGRMEKWIDRDEYYYVLYSSVLEYYDSGMWNKKELWMVGLEFGEFDKSCMEYGEYEVFEDLDECVISRYGMWYNGWNGSGDCGFEWVFVDVSGIVRYGMRWY